MPILEGYVNGAASAATVRNFAAANAARKAPIDPCDLSIDPLACRESRDFWHAHGSTSLHRLTGGALAGPASCIACRRPIIPDPPPPESANSPVWHEVALLVLALALLLVLAIGLG